MRIRHIRAAVAMWPIISLISIVLTFTCERHTSLNMYSPHENEIYAGYLQASGNVLCTRARVPKRSSNHTFHVPYIFMHAYIQSGTLCAHVWLISEYWSRRRRCLLRRSPLWSPDFDARELSLFIIKISINNRTGIVFACLRWEQSGVTNKCMLTSSSLRERCKDVIFETGSQPEPTATTASQPEQCKQLNGRYDASINFISSCTLYALASGYVSRCVRDLRHISVNTVLISS